MKYILSFFVKKFGISALVTAISIFYFTAVIAFYFFMINALLSLYSIIQTLIDLASFKNVTSSSSVFDNFMSYLDVVGFIPALNDSMPLIVSALIFMLSKILWKYTTETYTLIVAQMTRAANLYV